MKIKAKVQKRVRDAAGRFQAMDDKARAELASAAIAVGKDLKKVAAAVKKDLATPGGPDLKASVALHVTELGKDGLGHLSALWQAWGKYKSSDDEPTQTQSRQPPQDSRTSRPVAMPEPRAKEERDELASFLRAKASDPSVGEDNYVSYAFRSLTSRTDIVDLAFHLADQKVPGMEDLGELLAIAQIHEGMALGAIPQTTLPAWAGAIGKLVEKDPVMGKLVLARSLEEVLTIGAEHGADGVQARASLLSDLEMGASPKALADGALALNDRLEA